MRGEPLHNPRRVGKHIADIIDLLLVPHGATDIRVYKSRHVMIVFRLGEHEMTIRTACTPRDEHHAVNFARTALMRDLERLVPNILSGAA